MSEKVNIQITRAITPADLRPNCADCDLPYKDFPCDVTLPDDLWLQISPTGTMAGVLCPNCLCRRVVDKLKLGAFHLLTKDDDVININCYNKLMEAYEALEAQLQAYREALKPFEKLESAVLGEHPFWPPEAIVIDYGDVEITLGDLRPITDICKALSNTEGK